MLLAKPTAECELGRVEPKGIGRPQACVALQADVPWRGVLDPGSDGLYVQCGRGYQYMDISSCPSSHVPEATQLSFSLYDAGTLSATIPPLESRVSTCK